MKKFIALFFLLLSCKSIEEQTIGYDEIVATAWESFVAGNYYDARSEFNNALTYDILDNVAEAYVGLGWTNLYIANLLTDLQDTDQRNLERDQAFNNFITAEITNFEQINDGNTAIDQDVVAILTAGLLFVYDYRLFKYNHLYFNCDEIYCGDDETNEINDEGFCECGDYGNGSSMEDNPEQFRYHYIIPTAINVLKKTNTLFVLDSDFSFPYDPSINMDDVYFIRANLAFQFDNFSIPEFQTDTTLIGEDYFIATVEICKINEMTETCLELGFEENGIWNEGEIYTDANDNGEYDQGEVYTDLGYCSSSIPNIPVDDFLACLSSFHTPVNGVGND